MKAIYRFADDIIAVGQILNNNVSECRKQIEGLVTWCNENKLSLDVDKTKELKKGAEHALINVNRVEVDRVESVKFLGDRKKRQKVVCTAQTIMGSNLPSIDSNYTAHCRRKATNIIKDSLHAGDALLQLLLSGSAYRSLNTCTSRFKNRFFPAAIKLMNELRDF
eukprot:g27752.t1